MSQGPIPSPNDERAGSAWSRWLQLVAVVYPAGLYVGAQTIANAVLPQMQGDLSAGLDQISWVITASVVASALGIPPCAWLAARFGRRRVMVASMLCFSVCSCLVGFADSLGGVVLFRILQSLVGAPIVALSQATIIDVFPEEERGSAIAGWSAGVLVGWVMAPSLGAYIGELHSWRVIFFVLLPLGLLGALSPLATEETDRQPDQPFDWMGFATVSVFLICLLVVLNRGQREDWFESDHIVWLSVGGGVALYGFVVHTWRTDHPFIRWRIFKDWNYALGILIVFVYASLSLAPLVLIPTMLAELKGLELLTTGIILIPRGLSQIVGLLFIGYLMRKFDPRAITVVGWLLFAAGGWPMVNYNLNIGWWDVVWPNLVQGAAQSLMLVPATTLLYAKLSQDLRVDGASVMQLAYSLASSIGVALSVTLLTRTSQVTHEELAARVIPSNELLYYPQYAWVDFDSVASLSAMAAEITQQALMVGYVNVYWVTFVFTLLATPLALAFKVRKRAATKPESD